MPIRLKCDYPGCNNEFFRKPSEANNGRPKYCSNACQVLASAAGRSRPLEERFWEKVQKADGDACWLWTGSVKEGGYGMLAVKDPDGRGWRPQLASRISWELAYGPIPEGEHILHRCDCPPCVRPDHLFLGDNDSNIEDKMAKGRQAKGSAAGYSKLDDNKVLEIRRLYHHEGVAQYILAERFGIGRPSLHDIIKGKTWKHLPLIPD